MKKILVILISLSIGIGLLYWVISVAGWQEIKKTILTFTGWQGLAILGVTIISTIVGAWKWKEILDGMGLSIPMRETWEMYCSGLVIRYFASAIVVGAELFQGYALKEKYQVPWSKGMASIIIDRALDWITNFVTMFFGIAFLFFKLGILSSKLALISGGMFLVSLIGFSVLYFQFLKRESIVRFILKFVNRKNHNEEHKGIKKEIFDFLTVKKGAFRKSFIYAFLEEVLMILRAWLLINFLGKGVSLFPAMAILSVSYLVTLVPIPAAIGSHEAAQTLAFNSLGLGINTGIVYAMISRGADLILLILGIAILFHLGLRLVEIVLFKKIDKFINHENHNSELEAGKEK